MEEELKKANETIAALQAQLGEVTEHNNKIKSDLINARKHYEGKESELTEREKEIQAKNEELIKGMETFTAKQQEFHQTRKTNLENEFIKGLVGEDQELMGKVKANLGRLADYGEAFDDTSIKAGIEAAYNMLGMGKPAASVAQAHAIAGTPAGGDNKDDFTKTEAGKGLYESLVGGGDPKDTPANLTGVGLQAPNIQ